MAETRYDVASDIFNLRRIMVPFPARRGRIIQIMNNIGTLDQLRDERVRLGGVWNVYAANPQEARGRARRRTKGRTRRRTKKAKHSRRRRSRNIRRHKKRKIHRR